MMSNQYIFNGLFSFKCAYFLQSRFSSETYKAWTQSTIYGVTSLSDYRCYLIPFPITSDNSRDVGRNTPDHLFQKSTPGILSLLRKSLNLRKQGKVEQALCQFIMMTGQIVYLFSSAYLMNPLRFYIQMLIYVDVVIVASQYPPGRMPIFLPFLINLFRLLGLTAWNPHSFRKKPANGKLRINLLDTPTAFDKGPSLIEFNSTTRLIPTIECGCTPKIHLSFSLMISSQMMSNFLKYLSGCTYLLMKSIYF